MRVIGVSSLALCLSCAGHVLVECDAVLLARHEILLCRMHTNHPAPQNSLVLLIPPTPSPLSTQPPHQAPNPLSTQHAGVASAAQSTTHSLTQAYVPSSRRRHTCSRHTCSFRARSSAISHMAWMASWRSAATSPRSMRARMFSMMAGRGRAFTKTLGWGVRLGARVNAWIYVRFGCLLGCGSWSALLISMSM